MKYGEYNIYLGDNKNNLMIKIQCFIDDRWVDNNICEIINGRLDILTNEASHKFKESLQGEKEQ